MKCLLKERNLTRPDRLRDMKNKNTMGMGVALGVAIGTAIGVATDNLALWLSLGIAIGVAIAGGIKAKNSKKD